MREILFRGKRINNGKWVEGYLIVYRDRFFIAAEVLLENVYNCCDGDDYDFGIFFEVDPSTVGQYTGLTANGKKIFEGDIINYNGTYHKVIWEDRNFNARFGIVIDELETWDFSASVPANLMEVIGNIHDDFELLNNPELLEVEE